MYSPVSSIDQLPYDNLDETLFHAVLEGDFGLAKFDGTRSGGIRRYGW
ncbi:Hcp1 family type VI secretion system effector [Sporosarcina newyorkensis 2681]|uniref:Hcp1 family type VI secretion system effector n=1 Tax=Sporosarcina newyorkensis 2681 TaxID=1027292 RepID=F9DY97_9BACL|nr:Hcp1 family type VI secretion system effector [Sporosarcina newyorkensis 2681]